MSLAKRLSILLALSLLAAAAGAVAETQQASQPVAALSGAGTSTQPISAASGQPAATASAQPSPAAKEVLTPAVAKTLLPEFQKAQSWELKALEHRHKLEIKELKASQAARQKEWERQEKDARHKFFSEHQRGPDRRAYVRDFMDRRRAFLQLLSDELKQRIQEQEARANSLKSDQAQRLREFKDALGRGERPSTKLWPSAS